MNYLFPICFVMFLWSTLPVMAFPAHDKTDVRCLDCHVSLPFEAVALSFHDDIPATCSRCHEDFPCSVISVSDGFRHPVGVTPSMTVPKDMVLDIKGRVSCITCHVFHEGNKSVVDMNDFYLRRPPGMRFCYACHEKL